MLPLVLIIHIEKSKGNLLVTLTEVRKDITSALDGILAIGDLENKEIMEKLKCSEFFLQNTF